MSLTQYGYVQAAANLFDEGASAFSQGDNDKAMAAGHLGQLAMSLAMAANALGNLNAPVDPETMQPG